MEFLMKILAIGAHYDDIEIGCGGTLLKHIEKGDEVHFAITSSDEFRTGIPGERLYEQTASLDMMGVKERILNLFSYREEVHNIIGELDKIHPDTIFTQFEFDTHQDHRRAFIIGQAVGRKRDITTLFYDSGAAYNFNPNMLSIINFQSKLKLLKCYKTQIDCGAVNLDILKKKDAYWASLITDIANSFAEGFVVRKMKWRL